jgi:hypothetical protein
MSAFYCEDPSLISEYMVENVAVLWDSPPHSSSYISRDSVVGIATGYGLDDGGVGARVPVEARIFSSPRRPDRLRGPSSVISTGYGGSFPRGLSGSGVKLTTHLQLMPRSRKCGSIHPLPISLHGVVLNQLSSGTTLLFIIKH